MTKLGWIKPDTKDLCYLRWDPKVERLKPDPEREAHREALPYAQGIATVEAIRILVGKVGPVSRFHPGRQIEEEMKGSSVTFSLQLSLFNEESVQLRKYMTELTGNSITQLMAMAWKPERAGRSALANQVQRSIQNPSSSSSSNGRVVHKPVLRKVKCSWKRHIPFIGQRV